MRLVSCLCIALVGLSGCASVQKGPTNPDAGIDGTHSPSKESRLLCSGRLRLDVPIDWNITPSMKGSEGKGPGDEKFELVALRRPGSSDSSLTPSAESTLQEFVALKTATVNRINYIKLWQFSPFQLSQGHPAASVAVLYPGKPGQNDYTIQYILAEPGMVFMLTFDRENVTESDVVRDRKRFDAIAGTARWTEIFLAADSRDCK